MTTVCIATYNGEKYLVEQLDSIMNQISLNDEVIISDDGSTDNTIDIIKSYNDKRIKLVFNKYERGYTGNFENALSYANGDYIFLADQDDIWNPQKVSTLLNSLIKFDFVVSDCEVVNEELDVIDESHFNTRKVKKGFMYNLLYTRYVGAAMAFNKDVLKKSLPFPVNRKYCAHDYWICLIAEKYFKTGLINTPLIKYRRHSSNASNGGEKSSNSLLHKVLVRIYTLFHIIRRR